MKHQNSSLQLCGQPTVLTLTQSTTRFSGSCSSVCTAARFVTSTSWSRTWSKSGNISTRWSSMKWPGSGVHVLELAFDFKHTVDILNTDFRCAGILPFAWTHTWLVFNLMSQCWCRISLKSDVICQSYGNVYSDSFFHGHCVVLRVNM